MLFCVKLLQGSARDVKFPLGPCLPGERDEIRVGVGVTRVLAAQRVDARSNAERIVRAARAAFVAGESPSLEEIARSRTALPADEVAMRADAGVSIVVTPDTVAASGTASPERSTSETWRTSALSPSRDVRRPSSPSGTVSGSARASSVGSGTGCVSCSGTFIVASVSPLGRGNEKDSFTHSLNTLRLPGHSVGGPAHRPSSPWTGSMRLWQTIVSVWAWLVLVVCVLVWFPVLVVARLLTAPFDPGRYIPGLIFRKIAPTMAFLNPLWRFHYSGTLPENARRPFVVVSNHESFTDILLISHLPWEMKWLSKAELFRIPIMGWMMWLVGDIPVKRGFGPSAIEAMALEQPERVRSVVALGILIWGPSLLIGRAVSLAATLGLGADHRALGERRELDLGRAIVLARVLLELHLHLDPHDAVVVLLQTGELLRDMFAEAIGHLAVPSRDHNLHVNLLN